ncbi:DUF4363 family protein [Clostridium algidicarnis]|uniref:DUF4363 family protein n=1 Tax=Clostridium algidicarnis TaxID=37659 RepID=UPI001C0A9637|nr:DUF4363 family protein [Clostridium algidicarnis]MBU3197477.1 DUF4363 family protein [Clostridium algidicarnis]MBU3210498.1 DUF4363 family protein [Clostridium algidicarnis]MBU3228162.1 DUF4363 family protein [Clostridium algidicarnis]MBU3252046.1 DUF4363 family protein [Clostridium algidicarnis]
MSRNKSYIMVVFALVVFIAIMTTGGLLKKPFSEKDNVKSCIESVKRDVESENWIEAKENLTKLKTAWKIVGNRVQFSVERNEMIAIDRNIARLNGSLETEDKISALIELSELSLNWDDLQR